MNSEGGEIQTLKYIISRICAEKKLHNRLKINALGKKSPQKKALRLLFGRFPTGGVATFSLEMNKKFAIAVLFLMMLLGGFRAFFYVSPPSLQNPVPKKIPILVPQYAKNFSVDSLAGYRVLSVRNTMPGSNEELRWILLDSTKGSELAPLSEVLKGLPVIHIPVKRVAILSTTYLGYMKRLGIMDKVIAISERKYISDSAFYLRIDSIGIPSVGSGPTISVEALFASKPDLVLDFATGASIYDDFPRLKAFSFPVVLTAEWLEKSPLAKAEWLKLFGLLFGCEARAESLFVESEKRYLEVRDLVKKLDKDPKPMVFTGFPMAGTWYASGGMGYTARLIQDAGGEYLWGEDTTSSALTMPLEKVIHEAKEADFWLNPGSWRNYKEGIANESRIVMFKAWRENRVYQYDLSQGPEGGLDFYEGAVVFPEKVLLELVNILHPGIFKDVRFRWYRNLSNL